MINSNVPLPYSIEYSKPTRSSCKKCRKSIEANALRMSHRSLFSNGNIDSWFHYECFWQKLVRGQDDINISSIRGVDWLEWKDQEDLRERIKRFKDPNVRVTSEPTGPVLLLSKMKCEKSATNRAKCTRCQINYKKGEIKVHYKSKSFHFKCHLVDFDNVTEQLTDIRGWEEYDECWREGAANDLAEFMKSKKASTDPPQPAQANQPGTSDQRLIDSKSEVNEQVEAIHAAVSEMIEEVLKSEAQIVTSEVSNDQPTSSDEITRAALEEIRIYDEASSKDSEFNRKRKLGKEARLAEIHKRRMKKQADHLLEKLKFFTNMSTSDRNDVLSENNQELPEGHDSSTQVLERLSDYSVYGCPIDCQNCPNGKIVYNSSRRTYVCTGYATEYSKCPFETKNPVRTPFILPARMHTRYDMKEILFNVLSERIYLEGEEEEIVKTNKRQSKGGVHNNQFFYAAEQIDSLNSGTNSAGTASNTHIIKHGTVVDANFGLARVCHVFRNETDGSLYQATLSFTDLTQNKNSYYKIQLLKHDTAERYYIFRSWGRVGTEVGDFTSEGHSKESAVKRFGELFHEKTMNQWAYRKHFRKIAGKFSYVETDYSEIDELGAQDVLPGSKTRLPQPVKEIVMSIFDIENMKSALKSFEMDINKMPLGRLSAKQINLAFAVLGEISDLLTELPVNNIRILDASNKFYTIIPHNFGMKVPEPIDSLHRVVEKNNMLNALLDIKFAYDQICGDNATIGVDPVDSNYQKLMCLMEPMEKGCQDWNMIDEYLKNTRGSTHDMKVDLIDIVKLSRVGESAKFNKQIGNRRLLWHGSGKMNFAGILGQGLRIAPPEAPVSGYMFGKGVYFADMFSKSFFYCRANQKEEAYLLLCDVALGNSTVCMSATNYSKKTLPKQAHSVHGMGRECPDPKGNYNHPDGFMIPKGKSMVQLAGTLGVNYQLLYNEFIVYDVDQIQMKYLVRVKMHHARHL